MGSLYYPVLRLHSTLRDVTFCEGKYVRIPSRNSSRMENPINHSRPTIFGFRRTPGLMLATQPALDSHVRNRVTL
jgi:hypothetical protein